MLVPQAAWHSERACEMESEEKCLKGHAVICETSLAHVAQTEEVIERRPSEGQFESRDAHEYRP